MNNLSWTSGSYQLRASTVCPVHGGNAENEGALIMKEY